MKKTYIIPQSMIVRLMSREQVMMQMSTNIRGDVTLYYGGESEGEMTSDVKIVTNVNIWDEEW